jgi:hypothetical protein
MRMESVGASLVLTLLPLLGCWGPGDYWHVNGLAGAPSGGARVTLETVRGPDPKVYFEEVDIDGSGNVSTGVYSSPLDRGDGTDLAQLAARGINISDSCPATMTSGPPTITSTGAVAWSLTLPDVRTCSPLQGGLNLRALTDSLLLVGSKDDNHTAVVSIGYDGTLRWKGIISIAQ